MFFKDVQHAVDYILRRDTVFSDVTYQVEIERLMYTMAGSGLMPGEDFKSAYEYIIPMQNISVNFVDMNLVVSYTYILLCTHSEQYISNSNGDVTINNHPCRVHRFICVANRLFRQQWTRYLEHGRRKILIMN